MSLLYISQQIMIYVGLSILVLGVIGNGMNTLVFLTVRTYRTTPCTFYFLINSIDNTVFIAVNLLTRVLSTGFGIDSTRTSTIWCKTRGYLLVVLSLIAFACSCLATIDQYFVTSRSAYLRNLSNIKWAHRIVFIVVIVCCLHGVPSLIYLDISPITQTCVNTNTVYSIYLPIYSLSFTYLIPVFTMVVFGYLTYRNIRQTRALVEQQADRQLIKMTLMQIILVVIAQAPYGINNIYSFITSTIRKDEDRLLKESVATTLVTLLTYVYYAGCCYIFLIVSSRFRRAIGDRLLFWRKLNQVIPAQRRRRGSVTIGNTANS